jgi:hypothetical protein
MPSHRRGFFPELVGYLAVTRNDRQQPLEDRPGRPVTVKDDVVGR